MTTAATTPVVAPGVPWRAGLYLAGSMALVGSYVGLSRLLVAAIPLFLLMLLRFAIAALAMLPWLRRQPGEAPLTPRLRRLLFLESLFGNFLFSVCMLGGVLATSALAAAVAMATIPAAVAILARLVLGEPVVPRVRVAIALAVTGIVVLAMARHPGAPTPAPWWGHALLLGAALCEATYVLIGRQLAGAVSPQRISAVINAWGLALVLPLGLWQAAAFDFATLTPGLWALLVFYALAASMVGVWLWMRGARHVPAAQSGVFTVLVPVSAAAIGAGVLGEPFGPLHGLAFTLALGGLLLATWPART